MGFKCAKLVCPIVNTKENKKSFNDRESPNDLYCTRSEFNNPRAVFWSAAITKGHRWDSKLDNVMWTMWSVCQIDIRAAIISLQQFFSFLFLFSMWCRYNIYLCNCFINCWQFWYTYPVDRISCRSYSTHIHKTISSLYRFHPKRTLE